MFVLNTPRISFRDIIQHNRILLLLFFSSHRGLHTINFDLRIYKRPLLTVGLIAHLQQRYCHGDNAHILKHWPYASPVIAPHSHARFNDRDRAINSLVNFIFHIRVLHAANRGLQKESQPRDGFCQPQPVAGRSVKGRQQAYLGILSSNIYL